jgi:hypothetical protein
MKAQKARLYPINVGTQVFLHKVKTIELSARNNISEMNSLFG